MTAPFMLDRERHPLLSRSVPIVVTWLWPLLVLWWSVALFLVPVASGAMFGWQSPWLVDGLALASGISALVVLVRPRWIDARIAFLVVPGFVFLGRFSTFITTDILATAGWRSRMIGGATYALASTGHVVLTAVSVMILTGGARARD